MKSVLVAAVIASAAVAADATVPWPGGASPSPGAIDALVDEALDTAALQQAEAFLGASEVGEDSEPIQLSQQDVDKGLTKEQLFHVGDELFEHAFHGADGFGATKYAALQRVHAGVRGGLDTHSCAGCHSVGGPDGAGSETENALLEGDGNHASTANARNPPAVLGLGFVQALGAEMSADLALLRRHAVDGARAAKAPLTVALESKGVSFGRITARPDGTLDAREVVGVDADLVVRPFGWKGTGSHLRRFVEDAARVHFGIQSHVLALGHQEAPDPAHLGAGPDWWDPDGDGVKRELEEGALTGGAVYLAMLESPVILPPSHPRLVLRWARGSQAFQQVGCAECHRRDLHLENAIWEERPDTTRGAPIRVDLLADGQRPKSTKQVRLFSDLKRHDMGAELADRHDSASGLPRGVFLTRPLWGLAETAPYLHDGRAATIPAAIAAHGGEARASRDAYAALSAEDQQSVHIFLLSLTRAANPRVAR